MMMQYKTRCVVLKTRRKQLQMFLALIDKSSGLDGRTRDGEFSSGFLSCSVADMADWVFLQHS